MSDLDQRPIKDEWKIVTDTSDPSIMKMFLNGQEFEVNSFSGSTDCFGLCLIDAPVVVGFGADGGVGCVGNNVTGCFAFLGTGGGSPAKILFCL